MNKNELAQGPRSGGIPRSRRNWYSATTRSHPVMESTASHSKNGASQNSGLLSIMSVKLVKFPPPENDKDKKRPNIPATTKPGSAIRLDTFTSFCKRITMVNTRIVTAATKKNVSAAMAWPMMSDSSAGNTPTNEQLTAEMVPMTPASLVDSNRDRPMMKSSSSKPPAIKPALNTGASGEMPETPSSDTKWLAME